MDLCGLGAAVSGSVPALLIGYSVSSLRIEIIASAAFDILEDLFPNGFEVKVPIEDIRDTEGLIFSSVTRSRHVSHAGRVRAHHEARPA